jgi:hypothetical protein
MDRRTFVSMMIAGARSIRSSKDRNNHNRSANQKSGYKASQATGIPRK